MNHPDDLAPARGIFPAIAFGGLMLCLCLLALAAAWPAGGQSPEEEAPSRKRVNISYQQDWTHLCPDIRDALDVAGTYSWYYSMDFDCMPETIAMAMWGPDRHADVWQLQNITAPLALIYNECERPDQCNTDPVTAADYYLDVFEPLVAAHQPAQKHLIGGSIMTPDGQAQMRAFFARLRERGGGEYPGRVVGVHLHVYHQGAYTWEQQALAARGFMAELNQPGWTMLLSESGWNGAYNYSQAESAALLTAMLDYWDSPAGRQFDGIHYYTALSDRNGAFDKRSLFYCYDGSLFGCPAGVAPFELTHLGEIYAAWEPLPAREREVPRLMLPAVQSSGGGATGAYPPPQSQDNVQGYP